MTEPLKPTPPANPKPSSTFVSMPDRPPKRNTSRQTLRQSFFDTAAGRNLKISFVGAGTWGTATARRVGLNVQDMNARDRAEGKPDIMFQYKDHIPIWINTDSEIAGRKLTTIINTDHENSKYLPGIKLPTNLVASTDLVATVTDCDVIFFTIPHQYLPSILEKCKGYVKPTCICVSLTKGLNSGPKGPELLSDMIKDMLGLYNDVAVIMGANIAGEVARDQFVETTVGCRNPIVADMIVDLLDAPCFRASACSNVSTVELCGALKNVVALGAGFCDALGLGSSTKAAVIRRGLSEVLDFCAIMDGPGFELKTVLHSCGVADTIATSMGGRNRLCAEEFAKKLLGSQAEQYGKPSPEALITLWGEIETRLLKGQKLQGLIATQELMECLVAKGLHKELLAEKKNKPYQTYANFMGFKSANPYTPAGEGGDTAKVAPDTPVEDELHYELRFGLFVRVHAIACLGDDPHTLFDW